MVLLKELLLKELLFLPTRDRDIPFSLVFGKSYEIRRVLRFGMADQRKVTEAKKIDRLPNHKPPTPFKPQPGRQAL